MLVACWSAKGGSGTTVVSVALALLLGRRSIPSATLADLGGDAPGALGIPQPSGPGIADWVAAGHDVAGDGLRRLAVAAGQNVSLIPRGNRAPAGTGDDGERLIAAVSRTAEPGSVTIIDCGQLDDGLRVSIAGGASLSLLVLRPCFLALRRAIDAPVRPSGIVLVEEPGRSLGADDVEAALGVPVRAVVPWCPSVARAVDAGLLATRVPRPLERALRRAA